MVREKKSRVQSNDPDGDYRYYKFEPRRSPIREILEIMIYGLTILIFFNTFVWQNFQIPTTSMENTLLVGDHITANTFIFGQGSRLEEMIFPFREIRRGDILVFKSTANVQEDWIKRCVAVPGDRFELLQDRVYINNQELRETYTYYKPLGQDARDPANRYYPVNYATDKPGLDQNPGQVIGMDRKMDMLIQKTEDKLEDLRERYPGLVKSLGDRLEPAKAKGVVPDGYYVVMGDNRNNSDDSREWGLVPRELIQGRAWLIWWSYGEDLNSHRLRGRELVWNYLRVPIEFWRRTHWPRCFSLIK